MAEINNGLPLNPIPVEYNNLDVSNLPSELVQDEKISPALKAYDTAYGLYNSKPEDQLTPAQKASREWVQEKTKKIISSGDKLNHKNYFSHNGPPYSMQEFLPTDDLVDFLSIEIDTLKNCRTQQKKR
jgi:hypothetical protein